MAYNRTLFKKFMYLFIYNLFNDVISGYYTYGFTLSQATKALTESRGIALLYFRPLH